MVRGSWVRASGSDGISKDPHNFRIELNLLVGLNPKP